jgi:hypothetical protein
MNLYDPMFISGLPLSSYTPGKGDPKMEGGWETSSGEPPIPLEWHLRDPVKYPYVTGAVTGEGSRATGQIVYRTIGDKTVPVKLADRGPGVDGKMTLDIASINPNWATNFPHQGQKDDALLTGPIPSLTHPTPTPEPTPPTTPGVPGGESGMMSTWGDLAAAKDRGQTIGNVSSAISSIFSGLGKSMASSSQAGSSQAMAMLNRKSPFESYLRSLLNPGGMI